jgi:hypothetical protein
MDPLDQYLNMMAEKQLTARILTRAEQLEKLAVEKERRAAVEATAPTSEDNIAQQQMQACMIEKQRQEAMMIEKQRKARVAEKQRRLAFEQYNEQAAEKQKRTQQLSPDQVAEMNQRAVEEALCGSNIAYRQMRATTAEKQRQTKQTEEIMAEKEKRTTEENVSPNDNINQFTQRTALTLYQVDAYLASARNGAYKQKQSDIKAGTSTSTSPSPASFFNSTSTPTVPLKSGARALLERRKTYAQVSVSRPAAGLANTRSEDRPITIPRIVPARSPPTASTSVLDAASANKAATDAKKDFERLEQIRLRQSGLPRQRAYDFHSLVNGGLESESDRFPHSGQSPSATPKPAVIATSTESARVGMTYPPSLDSATNESARSFYQPRVDPVVIEPAHQISAAHQPFVNSSTIEPTHKTSSSSGHFDLALRIQPAPKIALTYKASLDATFVDLVYSTQAKDANRRLRQAVTDGDDFEIVGHGELDDEFDLVDSQVPSAVNGKSQSDPSGTIDHLDSAFRAGWEDGVEDEYENGGRD